MASFDDIKQQAEKTANVVAGKAVEAAEAAGDWASKSRPEMDEAFEKGEDFEKCPICGAPKAKFEAF